MSERLSGLGNTFSSLSSASVKQIEMKKLFLIAESDPLQTEQLISLNKVKHTKKDGVHRMKNITNMMSRYNSHLHSELSPV